MALIVGRHPGPSDDSLRRVGLMRYAEPQKVPDACKRPSVYDEDEQKYHVPIVSQECVSAILGVDDSHIVTVADVTTLVEWWAKNSEDRSQTAWMITYGPLRDLIGDPVSTIPKGETVIDHVPLPTETISNAISDGFDMFTDPQTWLAIGSILVGGLLVIFGGSRWLRGGT